MEIPKKDKRKDPIYIKAYAIWDSMRGRCYRPNSSGYKYYGAVGVTIAEEWLTFKNFYRDLDKIDGWNEQLFLQGKLTLDKDYKFKNNKVYSLNNCCFISREKNNKLKPQQQKDIIAMSPQGEYYYFSNQSDFAKKHNLQLSGIHNCLTGKWKHTNYWQFSFLNRYNNDFVNIDELVKVIIGLSPEGDIYEFTNASEFAREHNLIEATVIYACANMKSKHTKLWQFRYKGEEKKHPFLPTQKLKTNTRNKKVKAIDPEGNVYYTTNRTAFAKEHNLSRYDIKKVIDGKLENTNGWVFSFVE